MTRIEPARPPVYRVGEVLEGLRQLLLDRVGRLWVAGELSNVHRAASGHIYFSLTDEEGQLRAALFRSAARQLAFEPENGLEVLAYGELDVYAGRGELQLVVRQLEPRGQGARELAVEQLRRRLEAEGLFAPERKRPLPELPRRIGIVTSPTGAALRDVLQVTRRRFPSIPLLLSPARVQGPGAEQEIAAALDALRDEAVSVILLVRGGGSAEDLRPFDSEAVARAIARSAVPIVSGVGHETDVSIADAVADLRAPTPSAAAELALPDRRALGAHLARDLARLERAARRILERLASRLASGQDALQAQAPRARLETQWARLLAARRALEQAVRARLAAGRAATAQAAGRLQALSPLAVLERGYAIVRTEEGGVVRGAEAAPAGARLDVRVARARLEVRVEAVRDLGRVRKHQ